MKLFRKPKIKEITLEQATKEIDKIIAGKDKSMGGKIVLQWYKNRIKLFPGEPVRENLIMEKYNKHNALAKKQITLEQIQAEVNIDGKEKNSEEGSKEKSKKRSCKKKK